MSVGCCLPLGAECRQLLSETSQEEEEEEEGKRTFRQMYGEVFLGLTEELLELESMHCPYDEEGFVGLGQMFQKEEAA